ncbi:tyrosine-type recombinase/integrase [Kribbella sp. WER1]
MSDTAPRRRKGEGSISRMHDHPTCPPVGRDGNRPEHECRGRFRARMWVTTMIGERTRPTLYGKTEREVINKLKELTAKEVTNAVTTGSLTIEDWFRTDAADLELANHWTSLAPTLRENTRKGYISKINRYIIPHLGKYRLDSKQLPDRVEAMWIAMRAAGLEEATLRGTHAILTKGFKVAVRRGRMSRNPCDLIDAPGTKVNSRRPLTVEEAWQVLKLAGDNPRFWLALLAGLRQGEALALRWKYIRLDEPDVPMPYLIVHESLSWGDDGPVFGPPKSETSTDRPVPLIPPVADRLRKLRKVRFAAGATEDDLVFPNPRTGRPMDNKRDWTAWTLLLELAGVKHTALHAARNTTSQLLENAGVPPRVAAEILGHADVKVTFNYQADNLPAAFKAMQDLDTYWQEAA